MRFTSLLRRQEIGANSYLIETGDRRIVLDSGMHPRAVAKEALPDFAIVDDDTVDAVILTHAHQDHIGSVPVLLRRQPRARVFCTQATRALSNVMLHNSVNVMLRQREELGESALPLFTHREADSQNKRWTACPLHQRFDLSGERLADHSETPVALEFYDAGHILGSAGVLVESEGKRLFYTGDVNFEDQTISRAARFPEKDVDILVMETTRGDSPSRPNWSRKQEVERLAAAITAAFDRGGCVLIPVFALGKTQELLAMLHALQKRKLLPHFPIYIGGLSTKLTEIHDRLAHETPRLVPELNLLDDVSPFVLSGTDAESVPIKKGRVYALSSGMMTENTLSNVFARRILQDPVHSIYFVGYADPESPGGKLQRSKMGEPVQLDSRFAPIVRACQMDKFTFSGHGTRETLFAYARDLRPKKIVLVHGDLPAVQWFKDNLTAALPDSEIIAAEPGKPLDL